MDVTERLKGKEKHAATLKKKRFFGSLSVTAEI
jgi:hypothetical protein